MLYFITKMKKINKQTVKVSSIALIASLLPISVFADGPDTAILPSEGGIEGLINIALTILTAGVGIAAVVAFVVAGIIYSTAGGNASQVQKAKTMILNTVIGLGAYALMWAFLQWLIPGGILN